MMSHPPSRSYTHLTHHPLHDHVPFGQIGHISTRSSDSQPQASATEYVVLSALHQAQGKPDTKYPRAPPGAFAGIWIHMDRSLCTSATFGKSTSCWRDQC